MHHSLYLATAVACGAAMPAAWAQADATPSTTITTTLPVVEIKASSTPALPAAQRASSLATGSAGSTLDTPFSVSSMPTEDLRAQGGTSLQDALRNVPGVQADSGFNGAHTQFFSIRGAIADSGTGSNRVLRDGVRLSNYPFVRAFIDSVDVLRGPGAALGVRSEPGGTVNLVTQQPQLANFGSATLGAGGIQCPRGVGGPEPRAVGRARVGRAPHRHPFCCQRMAPCARQARRLEAGRGPE